jgi:hypothetical protein
MAVALLQGITGDWDNAQESVRINFQLLQTAFNQALATLLHPQLLIDLVDGATVELDVQAASEVKVFRLAALGNRLLGVPSNPTNGQLIIIQHYAAGGANRTLSLTTVFGGFRFGSVITSLSATLANKTDYILAVYNGADGYWDIVGVSKG